MARVSLLQPGEPKLSRPSAQPRLGSTTGTCGEVLTTRPSSYWRRIVSSSRMNFSDSIGVLPVFNVRACDHDGELFQAFCVA
jgi:hypothetical protein